MSEALGEAFRITEVVKVKVKPSLCRPEQAFRVPGRWGSQIGEAFSITKVIKVKIKVKQSHYRSAQALKVPGGWGAHISRQSSHESGKVVSRMHRPPLPQEIFLVIISVRSWVEPRVIVRPEGLCQWHYRELNPRPLIACIAVLQYLLLIGALTLKCVVQRFGVEFYLRNVVDRFFLICYQS